MEHVSWKQFLQAYHLLPRLCRLAAAVWSAFRVGGQGWRPLGVLHTTRCGDVAAGQWQSPHSKQGCQGEMAVLMCYTVKSGMHAMQHARAVWVQSGSEVAVMCLVFSICFEDLMSSVYTSDSQ